MADDETITIRVNAAQGEAALKALGAAGIQAANDVGQIQKKTEGSTDKIAAFGAKLFGLTKVASTFGEVVRQVGNNIEFESDAAKEATKSTADLFTAIGSLDAPGVGAALGRIIGNLEAMRQGLDETTVALGNATDPKFVDGFRKILGAQNELIDAHKREVEALDLKAAALGREITTQQKNGEVQKFIRDELQQTLDAYEKSGEAIPSIIAEQAAALGVLSKSQQEAQESAQELEEASVKASEERAKAEQKAAKEIIEALAAETKALDDKLAKDQARLEAALNKGGKIDTSQDSEDAKKNIADLRDEIKKLEQQPTLDTDQINRLNDLKDLAGAAADEMRNLGKTFTQTADDFLTEAEAADAAGAAWDVYGDLLAQAANRQKRATQEFGDTEDALSDLADTTEEAADSYGELADSAGDLGESGKKGAEKAAEGLKSLAEEQDTVIEKNDRIKAQLAEIKQLASEITLE